jgi:hypothetical protein
MLVGSSGMVVTRIRFVRVRYDSYSVFRWRYFCSLETAYGESMYLRTLLHRILIIESPVLALVLPGGSS